MPKGVYDHKLVPLEQRFWRWVYKTDNCWFWIGASKDGYGRITIDGRTFGATQLVWYLTYGVWPEKNVCHTCDTPPCVRPNHLFEGTDKQNAADAKSKGTMGSLYLCRRGHEQSKDTQYVDPAKGRPECRMCRKQGYERFVLTRP